MAAVEARQGLGKLDTSGFAQNPALEAGRKVPDRGETGDQRLPGQSVAKPSRWAEMA